MRLKKYITFDQLFYWSQTTAPFTFNGVQVNPATQMSTVEQILLPFLNGSMDNPYSTTTPKEKLPQYFTVAGDIGNYLNEEFGDRLMASSYRGGEYYAALGRNLNNDEAMEVILQELISKTYHFVSIYGYQFIKLFGTASLSYNPIWNVDGKETKTTQYGQHITIDQHGDKQQTQSLGPTSESTLYGATEDTARYGEQSGSTTLGARTDTHSETQMNDLTFKNKSQDAHASTIDSTTIQTHTDVASSIQHTDTKSTIQVINTISDATYSDTNTSNQHTDVETLERHGNIGVTSTQNLIMQERQILDWNPALDFFKAYTDKVMLRCYGY